VNCYGDKRILRNTFDQKLGINPGLSVRLVNQPNNYFELLEADIADQSCKGGMLPTLFISS
jgi:hypothetical protein